MLGKALYGISSPTREALDLLPWTGVQWTFAAIWVLFMAYTEGYRGFQLRFSPRCVARAFYLAENPSTRDLVLAPFFVMGFYNGTRRRLITTWGITLGVVFIVLVVSFVPQPWRGIIDLGVVVGLSWGLLATLGHFLVALRRGGTDEDPQMPETTTTA